jgi:DNA-binding response OmpR family regulator
MNTTTPNLFLIDDDKNFMTVMSMMFENIFNVKTFHDPLDAIHTVKWQGPDAILLDMHIGGSNGLTVCQQLKSAAPDVPVFFFSSDTGTSCISRAFELGGVDYFSKSMPTEELVCRIKSRLKARVNQSNEDHIVGCRNIQMDLRACEIKVEDRKIPLTPKEFDLFKVFMLNQNRVLSKTELLDILWKGVFVDANNIDTHMFHIRKKFYGIATGIECRKGQGYILRSNVSNN